MGWEWKVYQRTVAGEIIIGGIDTKMRIGNGGMRHIDAVDYFLKIGGRTVGLDVVNDERTKDWMGKRKAKRTAYLTKKNQQIT